MRESIFISTTILITILTILLAFSFTFSKGGIIDTIEKEKRILELKKQIKELQESNNQKRKQIELLKTNPDYKNSIVKGLGIEIDNNEYVFRFDQSSKTDISPLNPQKQSKEKFIVLGIIILLLGIQLSIILSILIKNQTRKS